VPRRLFPVLLLLFAASGCAALIYEIVWLQLLQLVVGSTAVSLAVLLSSYMGGLCAGSYLLPRVISPQRHPLQVYGCIELGIGSCGVGVLALIPLARYVYAAAPGMLLRGLVCGLCLLPPTLLMGASLPAIARWLESSEEGISRLGFLYGANTIGAVIGCAGAGFYLLRVFDMHTATYVAAGVNAAAGAVSLWLARRTSAGPAAVTTARGSGPWPVYVVIALSGFTALGAEVVWTRMLSLLLGGTVYTFAIILAVFLAGIGLGSAAGSMIVRRGGRPRLWLAVSQWILAASIGWTAWVIGRSLPYWPINPALSVNPWVDFQLDLVRCLWAFLPGTLLWGASFPLALAAAAREREDSGALAGGIYAANTIGAIAGAILFSLVLIPGLGTQQSQRVLLAVAAVAGLLVARRWAIPVVALAGLLVWTVPSLPWSVIAYGRRLPSSTNVGHSLYVGEGMNASIVVSERSDKTRLFHISGKTEASNEPGDLKLERMLGHIPALLHPKPKSVLIVGFGAGVTAGTFTRYPEIERIVICEMEPLVPPATTRYFNRENYDVLHDPRTAIVYDDARHYMLTAREKFDIITSDPIHPWMKGSATLYSREYYDLVRARLNPGGRVTQWIPLYDSDMPTVKSEIATFYDAFPNATIWDNDVIGLGYDLVLHGQLDTPRIDVEEMQRRLSSPSYGRVLTSLKEVRLGSAVDLLSTFAGRARDIGPVLRDAEINRDRNLRLQYLAGLGVDTNASYGVYYEIMQRFRYPDDLFIAAEETTAVLKKKLGVTK
jgi:spermidine synthase